MTPSITIKIANDILWVLNTLSVEMKPIRCHDIQYNDIQHNDTQRKELHATLNITMQCIMLSCYAECHFIYCYAECHYAQFHYD